MGSLSPALLADLQPFDNLVVDAVDGRSKILVDEFGGTVADYEIAIGEWVGTEIGHQGLRYGINASRETESPLWQVAIQPQFPLAACKKLIHNACL